MFRKILLSAVAVSLVTGTAALAQDNASADKPAAEKVMPRGFQTLDADKDGFVTPEEFGKRRIDRLKAADTNGDGELTQDELMAYIQKRDLERRTRAMSRMLDIDGDGKIMIGEIEKQMAKRLALLDTNDDGKVSQDELARAHRFMGKGDSRFERHGGKGGHHQMMTHKGLHHTDGHHWKASDPKAADAAVDAPAQQ